MTDSAPGSAARSVRALLPDGCSTQITGGGTARRWGVTTRCAHGTEWRLTVTREDGAVLPVVLLDAMTLEVTDGT